MSSATRTATTSSTDLAGPSLARLVRVELRKSLDTRAGGWFAAAVAVLIVAAVLYSLSQDGDARGATAVQLFTAPWEVVELLLPAIGVLSMTSEWSQRTALTTFTLVPRRGRVLAAKLGAALVVTVAAVLLTVAVAAAVAAVSGLVDGHPAQWTGLARHAAGALLGGVCSMAMGAALGALVQQTAAALVTFFVAPTLVGVAATALLDDRAEWVAPTVAINRISTFDLHGAVAPSVVALVLWIALPLVGGAVRWLRRELP